MPSRRILVLIVLSLLLILSAVLFFFTGGGEPAPDDKDFPGPEEATTGTEQATLKQVVLYFLSESDGLFHPEPRTIPAGPSVEGEARRLVEELIKGSQTGLISPLPPESQLRQVFLTRGGTAVVDFSREFSDRHPSGSTAEMATVYCLVNSLTANFKPIKRVFILVNGNERETLSGHISLTRPFLPLSSLIVE